jgi:hypothetical protein
MMSEWSSCPQDTACKNKPTNCSWVIQLIIPIIQTFFLCLFLSFFLCTAGCVMNHHRVDIWIPTNCSHETRPFQVAAGGKQQELLSIMPLKPSLIAAFPSNLFATSALASQAWTARACGCWQLSPTDAAGFAGGFLTWQEPAGFAGGCLTWQELLGYRTR